MIEDYISICGFEKICLVGTIVQIKKQLHNQQTTSIVPVKKKMSIVVF